MRVQHIILLASLAGVLPCTATAAVLRVEADGSAQYSTISGAVSAAEDNDVIQIGAGVFEESITINHFIALLGSGPDLTIIRPEPGAPAIVINQVSGDAFSMLVGFTIEGGAPAIRADAVCDGEDTLFISDVHFDAPETIGVEVELCDSETVFALEAMNLEVTGAAGSAISMTAAEGDDSTIYAVVIGSRFSDCGGGVDVRYVSTEALPVGTAGTVYAIIADNRFVDIADEPIRLDVTHSASGDQSPLFAILRNEILDSGGGIHLSCDSSALFALSNCYAEVANNIVDGAGGPGLWLETAGRGAFGYGSLLLNNTVVKGQGAASGHGVQLTRGGTRELYADVGNNILFDNDGYGILTEGDSVWGFWLYNNVTYNLADSSGPYDGFIEDPQHADPLFMVYDGAGFGIDDDLRLGPGSPCIDAGYPEEDFEDPDGSPGDLGAYGGPIAPAGITSDDDGDGFTELEGDCDDEDPLALPGGSEVPLDGVDQDCDSFDVVDADADGYRGGADDGFLRLTGDGAIRGDVDELVLQPPDLAVETGTAVAMEAWVRFGGDTGSDQALVQLAGDLVTPGGTPMAHATLEYRTDLAELGVAYAQHLDYGTDASVAFVGFDFELAAEIGVWHHLAASFQTTSSNFNILQVYLDGELMAAEFYQGSVVPWAGTIRVGAAEGSEGWQDHAWADLDDVRAREGTDLTGDFGPPGRPVGHDGCLVWWGFDAGHTIESGCGDVDGEVDGTIEILPRSMDCDDADPISYPGAPEICDLLDNDCDGEVPADEADADADGYGLCDGDCDDDQAASFPGNPELCDGLDNDCNGDEDEGLDTDADGDGHYLPGSCAGPADDCDDDRAGINPSAREFCDDQLDNDCNGLVDADDPECEGWVPPIEDDEYVGFACACSSAAGPGRASSLVAVALLLGLALRRGAAVRSPRR